MGIILKEKTKENFGYYPQDLKPSSSKMVVWKCENCGIELYKKFQSAKKIKLCFKCSAKVNAKNNKEKISKTLIEYFKTHESHSKGIKMPDHVKEALKKSHEGKTFSEERKKEISIRNTGKNNPFYGKKHSEESLQKMREKNKKEGNPMYGKKYSEEELEKRRGKNNFFYGKKPFHGRGEWYICKDGSKVWMRSSWEIKFAKYLDVKNIEWLYESKTFPIIYDNKEGTYTPDFYLIKENEYIEIKGWWRDNSLLKFNSFLESYPKIKIEVYEKNKLKELKIL